MDICKVISFSAWKFKVMQLYEKVRGVDFITCATNEELGTDREIANAYSISSGTEIRAIINSLIKEDILSLEDGFFDFGCGKGNILRLACKMGFERVKGVELSGQLVNIAHKNMEMMGWDNVVIENCDARIATDLDYYNVFYFYNPFPKEIMKEVLWRLKESVRKHNRRIVVIYVNAVYSECFEKDFSKVKEFELKNRQVVHVWTYKE